MAAARRFVTSPHLVAYWENGDLMLRNYAVGTTTVGGPATASIVHACATPQTLRQLVALHAQFSVPFVDGHVAFLLTRNVLYVEGATLPPQEVAMRSFGTWNPAAGFFHSASKHVGFDRSVILAEPPPLAEPKPPQRSPRRGLLKLPFGSRNDSFARVLLSRRTWRRFSSRKLKTGELATLLRLTFGAHEELHLPDGSRAWMRTSPSGGACHPIDGYVAALHVQGTAPGLYGYSSEMHALHKVKRPTDFSPSRYLPAQPWYDDAALLVFFVATFERTRRRYSYSRAYRAVMIEAGHLCQTFCLVATSLGLAPFCSLALADANVETDLGIDGIHQSVIYAAGVGAKGAPDGEGVAPRSVQGVRVVPNRVFVRAARSGTST